MIEIIAQELRTQRPWGGDLLSEEESLRIAKRLLELMQAGDDGQGALVERLQIYARVGAGSKEHCQDQEDAASRLEALARENAALRADKERLEQERDADRLRIRSFEVHLKGQTERAEAAERRLDEQEPDAELARKEAVDLAERAGIDMLDDHDEFITDLTETLVRFARHRKQGGE